MATPEQLRTRLAELARLANGDLDRLLRAVQGTDLLPALYDLLPALIDQYGTASGLLAAEWYDEARAAAGVRGSFTARPAKIGDTGAAALIGWASATANSPEAMASLLAGGLQRRVTNFGRQTVMESAVSDPRATGWQRVARVTGCNFCQMLAGRGAVYRESSVSFGAHDDCHCQAAPKWTGKADLFDVQEYRRSVRADSATSDADKARAREWIAANL